jgi:hypothetical protein
MRNLLRSKAGTKDSGTDKAADENKPSGDKKSE